MVSLQIKTAIFVYVSGQSSKCTQFVIFFMLLCLFTLSGLNVVMIAQGVGVGEEEPTKM